MFRRMCLILSVVVWLPGCSSLIFSSTAPPVYYQLDYNPAAVSCAQSFGKAVRIWDFTTSSPYNQPNMVVVKPNGEVLYSSSYQWAATPGTMIAQSLLRDLSQQDLFSQVVSATSPSNTVLELTGHVFNFSWERSGATSRAILQVKVSLANTQSPRTVLFNKEYQLQSPPFEEDASAAFAGAMSSLVSDFSTKLRKDLCTIVSSST